MLPCTANVPVAMYRDQLKPLLLQVLVVAVLERPQGGRDAVTTRVAHFAPLLRTLSHDDFGDMVLPALQANAKKVRPQLSCSPLRLLFCDPQMLCHRHLRLHWTCLQQCCHCYLWIWAATPTRSWKSS